ncbi:MAG: phosphoglucosamine mutase [Candidatus Bathyarchaeia archaeon]
MSGLPRLFGTSGIRGDVLTKVTPELALRLGLSLAASLGSEGEVAVGYDIRTTSEMLEEALVSGLMAGGCDVLRVGRTVTPVLAFTTRERGCGAGVMVTASHNPPTDNGLKCYSSEGMEYTSAEEEALEALILTERPGGAPWEEVGGTTRVYDAAQEYISKVLQRIPRAKRGIKVVVDCSNGAASEVTPIILSGLGYDVITLNAQPDGFFPGRPPEPTPENLSALCRFVGATGADFGIAHDGDADRFALVDEEGRVVKNDRVIALFAERALQRHHGGCIATSVDTSFCVDEAVARAGGSLERTRLGKTYELLKGTGRFVLASEPWKVIDPEWGLWGDGIYSSVVFTSMLDEGGGTVTDLLDHIPDYPQRRFSIPCPDGMKTRVMGRVRDVLFEETEASEVWVFDGVRVNYYDDSWLLIRASGTVPSVKVYAEARTMERLDSLVRKAVEIVDGARGRTNRD